MIACAYIIAQFTKVPLDAFRTDLICTDSMCLYFCTIDQGSLMSGHMIYFANITFAPQYCTIQGPCIRCVQIGHLIYFAIITFAPQYCTIQGNIVQFNKAKGMRCVQIGHLICFAAIAHVFAFLHISPRSKICINVSALPIIIAGYIACGNWHPHPSI